MDKKRAPLANINQNVVKRQKAGAPVPTVTDESSTKGAPNRKDLLKNWKESRIDQMIENAVQTNSSITTETAEPKVDALKKVEKLMSNRPLNEIVQEKMALKKQQELRENEEKNRKLAHALKKKEMDQKLAEEKAESRFKSREEILAKREAELAASLESLALSQRDISSREAATEARNKELDERQICLEASEAAVVERQKEAWLQECRNSDEGSRLEGLSKNMAEERAELDKMKQVTSNTLQTADHSYLFSAILVLLLPIHVLEIKDAYIYIYILSISY
jgi:hypothetical protein